MSLGLSPTSASVAPELQAIRASTATRMTTDSPGTCQFRSPYERARVNRTRTPTVSTKQRPAFMAGTGGWVRLLPAEDALLGCRIVSVRKHPLVVQFCELPQLRDPRVLVPGGHRRGLGSGGRCRGSGWLHRGGGGYGQGRTWAGRHQQLLAGGIHPEPSPEVL